MKKFMIRQSALAENQYYIDFSGEYTVPDIGRITGITENFIHKTYEDAGGVYNSERKVYYFSSYDLAVAATTILGENLKHSKMVKTIELTEEEIEYIRKALINQDSNIIFKNNRIKTTIFNKLNM